MRIVLVGRFQPSERLTGPEKFAKRLFNELRSTEHDVTFFDYFYRAGGLYQRLFGSETVTESVHRLGILPLLIRMMRERPDIVHIVTAERFIIPLLLLRFVLSGRVIATVHGDAVAETESGVNGGWKDRWLERLMMRHCDRIVAVSGGQLTSLQRRYPGVSSRSTVISHGVDDRIKGVSGRRYTGGPLHVVMMKRPSFVHDTGHGIAAALRLSGATGIIVTRIGGELHEEEALFRTVPPMEAEALASFLKEQHVVVNGAMTETFSIFTAECMAAGVVPIVNPNIGISEYIQDGVNGFVVPAGDADAYTSAILRLHADRSLLERLSRGAAEAAAAMDWPSAVRRYLSLYTGTDTVS
ncbi:MAG: glycosyltransferase family 4 protein [Bacteroidetes bacterium]|nr:MAG: glycosyltransferase family 4 protein [Bacteroidota bacterium]